MTRPLLVTGFPGSRLSWLSLYFSGILRSSGDERPCAHALSMHLCGEAYHSTLQRNFIGNCDPYLLITNALEIYPDAPVVLIKRHTDEVHAYANARQQALVEEHVLLMMHSIVEAVEREPERWLVVPYPQVDERLPDVCAHLGVPYDKARHMQLAQFDVHARRVTRVSEGLMAGWLEYAEQYARAVAPPQILDASGRSARAGLFAEGPGPD